MSINYLGGLNNDTGDNLSKELRGARNKFPNNQFLLAALVEEVGELAKALMDHSLRKDIALHVYSEAIQVAAMAIRIAEEGDPNFDYKYSDDFYKEFKPTGGKSLKERVEEGLKT